MDAIIVIKLLGSVLLAGILLLAVMMTSAFSVVVYIFKGFKPNATQPRLTWFRKNGDS